MRVRAAAILLALLTAGPALAEDRPRQRVGKVTLRVTQVFPETHQALVYDKATNKHVVVTEGDLPEQAVARLRAAHARLRFTFDRDLARGPAYFDLGGT